MVLKEIDWLATGDLKYLKGAAGSNILASDILNCLKVKKKVLEGVIKI